MPCRLLVFVILTSLVILPKHFLLWCQYGNPEMVYWYIFFCFRYIQILWNQVFKIFPLTFELKNPHILSTQHKPCVVVVNHQNELDIMGTDAIRQRWILLTLNTCYCKFINVFEGFIWRISQPSLNCKNKYPQGQFMCTQMINKT